MLHKSLGIANRSFELSLLEFEIAFDIIDEHQDTGPKSDKQTFLFVRTDHTIALLASNRFVVGLKNHDGSL